MNVKPLIWMGVAALAVGVCVPGHAQLPVLVDEDFSGATDPLNYWYQTYPNDAPEPQGSQDSYVWSDANDNLEAFARRGKAGWKGTDGVIGGYTERAYVDIKSALLASGYGDGDEFLEFNECFDFSFDFNISSFGAGTDEQIVMGLWYNPADGGNLTYHNISKLVGLQIKEDGTQVRFYIRFGNSGTSGGKGDSDDITGAASLATGTNYRIEGHYRYTELVNPDYDPEVHAAWAEIWERGQLYGTLTDLDTNTVVGEIAFDPNWDGPEVAWVYDFLTNNADFPFWYESQFGVGNYTTGATYANGPEYTTDNWSLTGCNPIPEPGTMALFGLGVLCLLGARRKK